MVAMNIIIALKKLPSALIRLTTFFNTVQGSHLELRISILRFIRKQKSENLLPILDMVLLTKPGMETLGYNFLYKPKSLLQFSVKRE